MADHEVRTANTMNDAPRPSARSGFLRGLGFSLGGLFLLVAFFYTEEDLRGWLAWQNCRHALAAKGEVLNWNAYIPPPVPDDQNFFKAPKMTEWFVRPKQVGHHPDRLDLRDNPANDLTDRLGNPDTTATNLNEAAATKYLAWSDQFQPDLDSIREALKRPYARMDSDYSMPFEIPIPNFVTVRVVAQTLAQRAKCDLLLGQPDQALRELTLLHDLRHLLEAAPSGKPVTLVAAMVDGAITGLYVNTIAGGLQSHAWRQPQLEALQNQLAHIHLIPLVVEALTKTELAASCHSAEVVPLFKWLNLGKSRPESRGAKVLDWLWPRGWTYQNMINIVRLQQRTLAGFDLEHDVVLPGKLDAAKREVDAFDKSSDHHSPYKILAAIAIPSFSRALQTTAHNQTMANEAQIVCALERYRLAHGEYPGALDALAPQLIDKLPHDLIGGEPLQYRRLYGGSFLLYSVGWNETDDDGPIAPMKDGRMDLENGDWVWQYPPI